MTTITNHGPGTVEIIEVGKPWRVYARLVPGESEDFDSIEGLTFRVTELGKTAKVQTTSDMTVS